eukprot:5087-Heterococcus_DN1.PRE.1
MANIQADAEQAGFIESLLDQYISRDQLPQQQDDFMLRCDSMLAADRAQQQHHQQQQQQQIGYQQHEQQQQQTQHKQLTAEGEGKPGSPQQDALAQQQH